MYAELTRMCSMCGVEKNLRTDFYYRSLNKEGRCKHCVSKLRKAAYSKNSPEILKRVQDYRRKSPEKIRETKLKQQYGVKPGWYAAKFAEQNGVCAICKNQETTIWRGKKIALSVDHDHLTGECRSLLCIKCNRAFGLLREDPLVIIEMLAYAWKCKK